MVFFKTKEGALIPFTSPLHAITHDARWPEQQPAHYMGRIKCGDYVVYEYHPPKHCDLRPMLTTLCTYVYEAIESAIEEGQANIIININDWEGDVT